MKTNVKISILALVSVIIVVACKKEVPKPKEPIQVTVTEDDVADVFANAIGTGTYGLSSLISESAKMANYACEQLTPCLYSLDTSIFKASPLGNAITYNYNLLYDYQMNCANAIPQNFVNTMSSSGELDQIRMSENSTATGTLIFADLSNYESEFTLDGTYMREGNATSKIRAKNSFSYSLSINIDEYSINKTSYGIESGSGYITLTANTSTGNSFTFNGTLSYQDENTATLVVGNRNFTIDIINSMVVY